MIKARPDINLYSKYKFYGLMVFFSMRLTRFSDYSLRLLLYLSQNEDRLATVGEIAEWYGISKAHLVKTAHKLATLGYIASVQGKGGGLRLGRPVEKITIEAVIRDTESDFHTVECFDRERNTCRITNSCALKHVLHDATEAFPRSLGRYSLADIASPIHPSIGNKRRN